MKFKPEEVNFHRKNIRLFGRDAAQRLYAFDEKRCFGKSELFSIGYPIRT